MKTEAQLREKLLEVIHAYEHDEGSSPLAAALTIQTLEWVLDIEEKYIDLSHPARFFWPDCVSAPGTGRKSLANAS